MCVCVYVCEWYELLPLGPYYLVLCGVEVFGGSSRHPVWPDLTLLHMLTAKRGVSCKDACMGEGLVCEPAHFKAINTHRVLREQFNCTTLTTLTDRCVSMAITHCPWGNILLLWQHRYVDFPPAWNVEEDVENGVSIGTCLTNNEPMLLSCAGVCVCVSMWVAW